MIEHLLAIDPGACSGWAFFVDGKLDRAGVTNPDDSKLQRFWSSYRVVGCLVIEIPNAFEKRNASPQKVQDLFRTVERAGRLIERSGALQIERVIPGTWKGNIDKDLTIKRVRAALTPEELAVIPALGATRAHNVYDAIGLGLWRLGRFGRDARK